MPYNVGDRVRVTSQNSEFRQQLGVVEVSRANQQPFPHYEVRIDGYPVGRTVKLTDAELGTTNFQSPIDYTP